MSYNAREIAHQAPLLYKEGLSRLEASVSFLVFIYLDRNTVVDCCQQLGGKEVFTTASTNLNDDSEDVEINK